MMIKQLHIRRDVTAADLAPLQEAPFNLLLVFGARRFFADGALGRTLRAALPQATVIGCSTAGEIAGNAVYDETLTVTALQLPPQSFTALAAPIAAAEQSAACGRQLGAAAVSHHPHSLFVLAPGLAVNGSALVEALQTTLGAQTIVTGGLAGDATRFAQTYTLLNDTVYSDHAVALAFHSGAVKVGYGSQGGWQPFGPERTVTRAVDNVLYELDGKSALALYKEYLGDKAKDLPGAGLLYPLAVTAAGPGQPNLTRTILNIDEAAGSLILAGSIANHSTVRLMHAKTEALVEGARAASTSTGATPQPSLAILISCVGRKLVMGDDVDEEVAAVQEALGDRCVLTGFYSYGEIAPDGALESCTAHLHNQTMTITHLWRAE